MANAINQPLECTSSDVYTLLLEPFTRLSSTLQLLSGNEFNSQAKSLIDGCMARIDASMNGVSVQHADEFVEPSVSKDTSVSMAVYKQQHRTLFQASTAVKEEHNEPTMPGIRP